MRVITGTARGKRLVTVAGNDIVRPTGEKVKEALFSSIQFDIEGRRVLDLFAGCGQLGIEALSRGAKSAVFVDCNDASINTVKQNLKSTGLDNLAEVVKSDYATFTLRTNKTFDIAFLDPPYQAGLLEDAVAKTIPLMSDYGKIFCEHPKELTLPESINRFSICKIYKYGKTLITVYQKDVLQMNKRVAVCPGSFDPITMGHLDIITRAATMFDKLIVVVMNNEKKHYTFSPAERVEMIKKCVADIHNVDVDMYDGLLADYAAQNNACAIIKGLRAMSDFEYEFQMALTNKKLNPGVETLFLTTSAQNMYLSSSMVKQIAGMGGDVTDFVPAVIHDDILNRILSKK